MRTRCSFKLPVSPAGFQRKKNEIVLENPPSTLLRHPRAFLLFALVRSCSLFFFFFLQTARKQTGLPARQMHYVNGFAK